MKLKNIYKKVVVITYIDTNSPIRNNTFRFFLAERNSIKHIDLLKYFIPWTSTQRIYLVNIEDMTLIKGARFDKDGKQLESLSSNDWKQDVEARNHGSTVEEYIKSRLDIIENSIMPLKSTLDDPNGVVN